MTFRRKYPTIWTLGLWLGAELIVLGLYFWWLLA